MIFFNTKKFELENFFVYMNASENFSKYIIYQKLDNIFKFYKNQLVVYTLSFYMRPSDIFCKKNFGPLTPKPAICKTRFMHLE